MATLRPPRALHLYQAWWQCEGVIVTCWNCVRPGELVEIGEVCVKKLNGEDEVVLEVQVDGGEFFVLVSAIDDSLAELCRWWRRVLRCDVRGADANVLEKIVEHLRVYRRGSLHAV